MSLRPNALALLLGFGLMLNGCGTSTPEPPKDEARNTPAASQDVTISDQAPAGSEPAAAAQVASEEPSAAPVAVPVAKDPFQNPFDKGAVAVAPGPATSRDQASTERPPRVSERNNKPEGTAGKGKDKKAEAPPAPPDFRLTGLVRSAGGAKALLATADGSRIVSRGDKVGDYRIASIDPQSVTVTRDGQTFRLNMEKP